jgi:hypothetical protein
MTAMDYNPPLMEHFEEIVSSKSAVIHTPGCAQPAASTA